ncbi:heat stress transcription factor A-8 [Ricinus communis]|uniref:Heat shock factor protein, putative n=1 Tax=Ricinus communis TaxID=3988 RepID=B9SNF4_RICCO|nr:heat stress transcription factor A-8 [Ricinus communis]EEF34832.1 Heat shock factor protein, putative [Ricinus communis]|eukprot:XP_002527523.1 heat stress transcription factor A-8 [Ricinus communis]
MVKSGEDGSLSSVAPFLKKCYEMVDDDSTNSIISWSQDNDNFIIWDMTQFSIQLLPKYFKHNNFSSFIRQLNIYGFRKTDTDRWEFANDGFIRGKKHLLKNICRRKNSQGADNRKSLQQQDNAVESCDKIGNEGLWKEIENLKTSKNALMQELIKLRQHQENTDNKLVLLRDRFQGMEKNQQQMLSFLVMVMQSPGFLAQLLHPKENNWRMAEPGSIVEQGADEEQWASGRMIVKYQPPIDEMLTPMEVNYQPPIEEMPASMVSENPQESNPFPDGIKDSFLSPDFMKLLMDENLSSFETLAPFILPEFPDDGAWEQLLLASSFSQNVEESKRDADAENEIGIAASGNQVDQLDESENFGFLVEDIEKYQSLESKSMDYENHSGKSQNLEIVTKKMALLTSEINQKNSL